MRLDHTSDLWWKNAIVYCLDAETFADSDGDGCGDLPGLTDRIDYLAGIGVTCLWLMPFYPSVNRDDGYDIVDFLGVDPSLGTSADLVELVRTARDRGIRVIADLVVNHTAGSSPRGPTATRHSVTSMCGRMRRPPARRRSSRCSPTPRKASGPSTRRRGSTTCTTSTATSPT